MLYQTGHIEWDLSTKMNQIRTFKELLLNLITSDTDQYSTKNQKKLKQGKCVRIDLTSNRYNLLKKTNALMENTVYTFADINCRLKVVNKENGEEAFFDNLEEVDLFLSQT